MQFLSSSLVSNGMGCQYPWFSTGFDTTLLKAEPPWVFEMWIFLFSFFVLKIIEMYLLITNIKIDNIFYMVIYLFLKVVSTGYIVWFCFEQLWDIW